MQELGFILRSQTLMKAEDTVYARRCGSEYLTQTTLFGWPSKENTSSFLQRSHTFTVRSFEAEKSSSSVAKTERTAWQWVA